MYPLYSSYVVLSELSLPIAKILPAHGQNGRLATCLGTEGPQSDVLQRFGSHVINFVCHLRYRNLAIMDQELCKAPSAPLWLYNTHAHLTTEVLNLDRAAFESHREAALELVLCSVEFL